MSEHSRREPAHRNPGSPGLRNLLGSPALPDPPTGTWRPRDLQKMEAQHPGRTNNPRTCSRPRFTTRAHTTVCGRPGRSEAAPPAWKCPRGAPVRPGALNGSLQAKSQASACPQKTREEEHQRRKREPQSHLGSSRCRDDSAAFLSVHVRQAPTMASCC